ncbi:L-histidine N(alpha)-methyltransferase [Archangium gephyra]|uniref:L-histidine N(alpha)-methyltransferase n=1 Tax=Archangium gephyra TaxID=48 RepID=UPI003B795AD3
MFQVTQLIAAPPLPDWAEDVRRGLTASPRRLPAYLLYDARGSALFEAITQLPEYYLTRTERAILRAHASTIATHSGPAASVVELGAGTATKTRVVLDAVRAIRGSVAFHPIDVSRDALDTATRALGGPGISVHPLVGRYEDALPLLDGLPGPRLVLFIGSSAGNLGPVGALRLLTRVRRSLVRGDCLVLGADLPKKPGVLLPAYDDAAGVTAAFEKNVLVRLNRELGADFEPDAFEYRATWDARASCVRMGLESLRAQTVHLPALGLTLRLARGEHVETERSYKWSTHVQQQLLARAGFKPERVFTDARGWFAVHLARVP